MRGANRQTWAFRLFLVALNVAGLLWIHHSVTRAPQAKLRVLSALPAYDVDAADRLSLVFDEPLPLTGALHAALAEPLFTLEPRVAGEWVWAAPERIEYRLDGPLPPGRRFKLRPAPHLERLTGRTLVGTSEFTFQTRPLSLLTCNLAGSDREHVNVQLRFNQLVDPTELLHHLKVTDQANNTSLVPQCLTRAPADKLTIRANRPDSNVLRIELEAALTGHGAELSLGQPVTRELTLSPVFTALRASVEPPRLGPTSWVQLEFSRGLAGDQDPPAVRINPDVAGLQTRLNSYGLTLEGPFVCGTRYTATVAGTLRSEEDEALGEDTAIAFTIPDREPAIQIPFSSGILSPHGNLTLDARAVNVGGVQIRTARVHANNLVSHLHGQSRRATAREMPQKTVPLGLEQNAIGVFAIDLRELLGREPRGVFHVDLAASDRTWTSDGAVVAITDLAIASKTERNGLHVWVTSLRSAQPVTGVQVAALSYNGQTLSTATTNSSGIARLAVPRGHPDGEPWLVTARQGDDVSFLELDQHATVLDDVDQSGRDLPTTYDVMLYTERGVYRPGDTVHLTGIVRDPNGRVPAELPLELGVQRPDGRKVATLKTKAEPSKQGMFHVDFASRDDGQTGPYRFTATLPGGEEVLGRTRVLVEEYVPVRLEVKAEPAKQRFEAGDDIAIRVSARYLFGQAAAGLPVKVSGQLRRASFKSKEFPAFRFDDPLAGKTQLLEKEDVLANDGVAAVGLLNSSELAAGRWEADLTATVTETGGRSVSDAVNCTVDTAGRYVGLRLPASVVPAGSPLSVDFVQMTGLDAPAEPAPMRFNLSRVDADVSLQEVDGRLVWKTTERVTPVAEGALQVEQLVAARGSFEVNCPSVGRYRLEVTDQTSGTATRIEFHAHDGRSDNHERYAAGEPDRVQLVLDREKYVPGSTARVLVKPPFAGTLLLTMETDRVVESRLVEITGKEMSLDWPVPANLRGGAFLTATLVRPVDPARDAWLPHRALGMARVLTDHSASELPLSITAPATVQPGETVPIRIQTHSPRDPAAPPFVHLWAVDEGILLTTAFATPKGLDHFMAPRRSFMTWADVFADLLPDYRRPAAMKRIGGDGSDADEAESLHRTPVPGERRAPAVVWLAAMPVGADGAAAVDVKLPDMNGEMRLMAVAVDGDMYGAAQQPVTLTSPLLAELGGPRFAAPGDVFEMPLKLFNSTQEPLRARLDVSTDGPAAKVRVNDGVAEVVVPPGASSTVWLTATTSSLGQAKVRVMAMAVSTGGESLTARAEAAFPVRPTGPLHAESKLLRVKAGEPLHIDPWAMFLPGTGRTTLSISPRPTVHLQPALESLLDYPYGCVEQTTSQLWALLYAPDLLKADAGGAKRAEAVADMVAGGVARLWSMQTRSGGLGYWPGDSSPNLWASAYAGEFMVEARRAGHNVDAGFAEDLARYLNAQLESRDREDLDANQRAQLCCVVAAMKGPPMGWLARLSEQHQELDMAGRAHLAAAWMQAGRKDRAMAVLPEDTITGTVTTASGGRLTSQVSQEAVLLRVLLDLDRDHPWIPVLAARLEKARQAGRWGSTLENATALAALARYQMLSPPAGQYQGVVRAAGVGRPFDHAATVVWSFPEDSPMDIESTGDGDLFVSLTTQGLLRENPSTEYDRQITVSREWKHRLLPNGSYEPLDPTTLTVGDLVFVETTLEAPGLRNGESIENVAIVDALPAGLEVENPRLATSEAVDWTSDEPDRVEFRDDRVVLFASARHEKKTFRYALRVVTAGVFEWPAIQASCMYDAGIASLHGGGRVEVRR
jgi:uncharacterized protein YfaS (alpha-2-macroglobulin family)